MKVVGNSPMLSPAPSPAWATDYRFHSPLVDSSDLRPNGEQGLYQLRSTTDGQRQSAKLSAEIL